MSRSKVVTDQASINGYFEMRFADGGKYRGEWKEGVPSGKGNSISPAGDTYSGEFLDGVPHGLGVHKWANGEKYEGQFAHGKKHGEIGMRMGNRRFGRVIVGGSLIFIIIIISFQRWALHYLDFTHCALLRTFSSYTCTYTYSTLVILTGADL